MPVLGWVWFGVCVCTTQVYGEGIYACFNEGSCVAPDTCTCADGWTGYDCNTRTSTGGVSHMK